MPSGRAPPASVASCNWTSPTSGPREPSRNVARTGRAGGGVGAGDLDVGRAGFRLADHAAGRHIARVEVELLQVGGERSEELVLALEVTRHHRAADDDALFRAVRSELADTVGAAAGPVWNTG